MFTEALPLRTERHFLDKSTEAILSLKCWAWLLLCSAFPDPLPLAPAKSPRTLHVWLGLGYAWCPGLITNTPPFTLREPQFGR